MDRRSFLKLLSAATAASLAPIPPSFALPQRIGWWEKGQGITVLKEALKPNEWGEFVLELADHLAANARETLEPGTRFEVRAAYPTYYGREQAFAWYATSDMQAEPTWNRYRVAVGESMVHVPELGYFRIAKDIA